MGGCQVVSRSDCCVWHGCVLGAWKTSFLLLAGTGHACVVEPCLYRNILILALIGINQALWKRFSLVLLGLRGCAVAARCVSQQDELLHTQLVSQPGTHIVVMVDHWLQHAAFPHSYEMDGPNTHTRARTQHDLITSFALPWSLSVSPQHYPPTSPGLISTSADGEIEVWRELGWGSFGGWLKPPGDSLLPPDRQHL